jgi:transposase InsO family protein
MSEPIAISQAQSLPLRIRVSLWMLCGAALGLPVDDLVTAIDQQLAAAKRSLAGKRLRMTAAERLTHARTMERLIGPFRELFHWIVSPEALIRWLKRHQLRRANGDGRNEPRKPGRPWIGQEKVDAILRIYDTGCTGLSRIVGEMGKCGLVVCETTVRRILTHHGRAPTDHNRRCGSTWAQFWQRHAHSTVGADFIQIPIGLLGRVVNAFVFVAIEHDTRHVHLLGITAHPTDARIAQSLRNATMDGEMLAGRKHWILDNDGKYGHHTAAVLGRKLIHTAFYTPDMNAYCERFIRSISEECLDHVVFLSEEHLREYVVGYLRHYNEQRPHQGIGNVPIAPWRIGTGTIVCDESLHGLLQSFRRAA